MYVLYFFDFFSVDRHICVMHIRTHANLNGHTLDHNCIEASVRKRSRARNRK